MRLVFLVGIWHLLPGDDLLKDVWHYWHMLLLSAGASSLCISHWTFGTGTPVKPWSGNWPVINQAVSNSRKKKSWNLLAQLEVGSGCTLENLKLGQPKCIINHDSSLSTWKIDNRQWQCNLLYRVPKLWIHPMTVKSLWEITVTVSSDLYLCFSWKICYINCSRAASKKLSLPCCKLMHYVNVFILYMVW